MAVLAMMCSNCSKSEQVSPASLCELRVKVSGIELSEKEFPTRAAAEEVSTVNRIVIGVFDADGTKVKEVLQKKGEEGYGSQNFRLAAGSYTIEAVAFKGDEGSDGVSFASQTELTIPMQRVTDAFNGYKAVSIDRQDGNEITVDMNRCVAAFTIVSNNRVPDDVYKMEFVLGKGNANALNPMTGFALRDAASTQSVLVSASKRSMDNPFFTAYVFLTGAEEEMTITVNAKNADNEVLYSHVIEGRLKKNRQLTATGTFFEGAAVAGFNFSDDWLEGDEIVF